MNQANEEFSVEIYDDVHRYWYGSIPSKGEFVSGIESLERYLTYFGTATKEGKFLFTFSIERVDDRFVQIVYLDVFGKPKQVVDVRFNLENTLLEAAKVISHRKGI